MAFLITIIIPLLILNVINISGAFRGNNYAILRGSTIRIGCIPASVQVEGESDFGSKYTWTGRDSKEVIDARFTKLASGELEITNAHVADSGNYTCKFQPPKRWNSKYQVMKSFHYKLIVYEIAGHTFHTSINLDSSTHTAEETATNLRDMLKTKACQNEYCIPGTIKTKKCALLESGQQTCEFILIYKGVQPDPDELCDEECVGKAMLAGLKKAKGRLKAALEKEADHQKSLLQPDMKSFETKHLITCRAGFRLVKTHHRRCFPCFPGTYSKSNSPDCQKCAIGFHQEHFGRHDCEQCEKGKTTDSVGTRSKKECLATNAGVLSTIKDSIGSLFAG